MLRDSHGSIVTQGAFNALEARYRHQLAEIKRLEAAGTRVDGLMEAARIAWDVATGPVASALAAHNAIKSAIPPERAHRGDADQAIDAIEVLLLRVKKNKSTYQRVGLEFVEAAESAAIFLRTKVNKEP